MFGGIVLRDKGYPALSASTVDSARAPQCFRRVPEKRNLDYLFNGVMLG
jgi:hypothetical protein